MISFLSGIASKLHQNNDLFSKVEYFENTDAFLASGITDSRSNYIYLRHINNANKFRAVPIEGDLRELRSDVRLVAQIDSKIDVMGAMESLVYQLEEHIEIQVSSYSDDIYEIYRLENGKALDAVLPYNLIMINFTTSIEEWKSVGQCKTLCKNCE